VGPWLLEEYIDFKRLCNGALRLESPEQQWIASTQLGSPRWLRLFPDLRAAEKSLRKHPVYRWLTMCVPSAVDTTGDETAFVQFRRARIVVEHIALAALPPDRSDRPDKRRKSLRAAIERIEESIGNGTLYLPNPVREEMLTQLLAEAKLRLAAKRPKSVGYPWLKSLAEALQEQTRRAIAEVLIEVATSLGLDCDRRTADRYVKEAQQASIADK
jgi:hypothetical protein